MKPVWTFRARQDLLDIVEFVARDNRSAARAMVSRLRERVLSAAATPSAGRIVPEFANPEIRELIVGNYRIVYRAPKAKTDPIVVLTAFEGHRMFPKEVAEKL